MEERFIYANHPEKRLPAAVVVIGTIFVVSWILLIAYEKSLAWYLGTILMLVGIYPLVKKQRLGEVDPFEPIYPFVCYFILNMGVRGLMDLKFRNPFLSPYDISSEHFNNLMSFVFLYSIIALISLYAGYYSKIAILLGQLPPQFKVCWSRKKVLTASLFCLIVGGVAFWLLFKKIGGIEAMKDPGLASRLDIQKGGRAVYFPFTGFLGLGFLMLYLYRIGKPRRLWEIILLAIFLIPSVIGFLLSGSKSIFLSILIYVLTARHYLKNRLSLKKLFVVVCLICLLVPLLYGYRTFGISHLDLLWDGFRSAFNRPFCFLEPIIGRSYGADAFLLIMDKTSEGYPFQFGRTFAFLFPAFIPRFLWPEKPWSFGVTFTKDFLSHVPGLVASSGPTLIGEFYLNFHLPGIIIVFFFVGVFMKSVYFYCIKRFKSREMLLFYSLFLVRIVHSLDGTFVAHITFILIDLFPAVVVVFGLLGFKILKATD
jgi:oligosaccharide repeat unit polymerase